MRPFLSKANEKLFSKYPIGSQEGKEIKDVLVKLIDNYGYWYIVEAEKISTTIWRLYGYQFNTHTCRGKWGFINIDRCWGIPYEEEIYFVGNDGLKHTNCSIEKDAKFVGKKIDCKTNKIVR